ncbi:MAG TPA: S46 family peptidase [Gemmataceae bacterium]|nr:S46 family peptidase [Gemmataceae bacterium]
MKRSWTCFLIGFFAVAGIATPANFAKADEGMWLFNNPPRKILKDKYQFDATDKWLEHVQKSSVRFNSGGSGSFVSADGLVMTNHHVGADALQKFGDKDHNYIRDGFHARTAAEEKRCHDLELNVLMSIEDVTDQVNAAVKPDLSPEKAFAARRKIIAEIEKKSQEETKLRSNVITLYQGGMYQLYRFKRYTDVRLVFAPEQQIAFYGGDPDNFEYPRYDLDICFFRVYEDDKPVHPKHYLKWSKAGAGEGELVFVSGHPGRTDRLDTMDELHYLRDRGFPYLLQRLNRLEVLLSSWSARSDENARKAKELLFGVQNSRKARVGGLAGLLDPYIMAKKEAAEKALRDGIANDPKLKDALGAWDAVAKAEKVRAANAKDATLLENGAGFLCAQFTIARTLLRAAEERPKPNGERLREYTDSNKEPLEFRLFSEEPIYNDFEILKLTDSLTFLAEQMGYDNELVQKVLAGKSPQQRAYDLVSGTKLNDVKERKHLYEGGKKAIDESTDPMIALAKLVDPAARAVRRIMESQVDEVKQQAYAKIAKAKFAVEGTNTYPDATFTLRLSFGTTKGYEQEGQHIPFQTDFTGLYQRAEEHHNKFPFDLPPRWVEKKDKLDLKTPFNFVCTADIIGGNSGSPVINKDAELVGIIFDGNIQSLVLDYIYTDEQSRAVAVHSAGIMEALRKVYEANDLADELTGRKSEAATR